MDERFYRCGCCDLKFDTPQALTGHFAEEEHKQAAMLSLIKQGRDKGLDIYLNLLDNVEIP